MSILGGITLRVEDLLLEKQRECRSASAPNEVTFTTEEIEVLMDKVALNVFRMSNAPNLNFSPCETLSDCFQQIQIENNLYRVLEFCTKKNRVCQSTVYSIFAFLEKSKEDDDV